MERWIRCVLNIFFYCCPIRCRWKFVCEYNFHNILLTLLKKIGQGNYPRYKRLFRNRTRWVVLGIKKSLMTKLSVLTVARRWAHSSWLTTMATMRMSKLWGKLSRQTLLFSSSSNVQYQKGKLVLAPVLWISYSMQASSWLKTFHLCLLKCLRTKFFLGTTATRWLSVASQTTAGLNTEAITLDHNPLCSLYKKNTTAWVNELVGMRKILEDQAEISEDEILGVRAPGLTPGFNAQYEVDIACHTFSDINFQFHFPNIQVLIDYGFIWDSSQGVPPRATPVWPYTFDYKMPHKWEDFTSIISWSCWTIENQWVQRVCLIMWAQVPDR